MVKIIIKCTAPSTLAASSRAASHIDQVSRSTPPFVASAIPGAKKECAANFASGNGVRSHAVGTHECA